MNIGKILGALISLNTAILEEVDQEGALAVELSPVAYRRLLYGTLGLAELSHIPNADPHSNYPVSAIIHGVRVSENVFLGEE